MTGGAVARRALEDGIEMAGLAGQVTMLADELEAGRQVIEGGALDRQRRTICGARCSGNGGADHAGTQQEQRKERERQADPPTSRGGAHQHCNPDCVH